MTRDEDGTLHLDTPAETAAAWLLWCWNHRVVLSLSTAGELWIDTTAADLHPLSDAEFQDVCTQLAAPIVRILAARRQEPHTFQ